MSIHTHTEYFWRTYQKYEPRGFLVVGTKDGFSFFAYVSNIFMLSIYNICKQKNPNIVNIWFAKELLDRSSLCKYNMLVFLMLFWGVSCLHISFCIERKIIKAFLSKESAPGQKMWTVSSVPLFTKQDSLAHFLILLLPLLPILDKFFCPENLPPVPPLAKTNNKTHIHI